MVLKIYKWDVFICHATEDKLTIVNLFYEKLNVNVKNVWYDKENIRDWDDIKKEIIENIPKTRILVCILSKAMLDNSKNWPWIEIGKFLDNKNDEFFLPLLYNINPNELKYLDIPPFIKVKNLPPLSLNNLNEKALNILTKVKKHKAQERKQKSFAFFVTLLFSLIFISAIKFYSPLDLSSKGNLKKNYLDSIKKESNLYINDSIGVQFNTFNDDLTTVKISNVTLHPGSSQDWQDTIVAKSGDIIAIRVSYHNTSRVSALNTSIRVSPQKSTFVTSQKFTGNISSINMAANCEKCYGSALVLLEGNAKEIKFITGSIRWFPDSPISTLSLPFSLQEELGIFSSSGIDIGNVLPDISCPNYQVYCHQGTLNLQYKVQ